MQDWTPNLAMSDKPHYLAIADAIADDIRSGRLTASDRLPPQRKLARRLDIDFTTVARGYLEAQKRGLIESHVGRGTFVSRSARRRHRPMARHPEIVDLSMNLPPEPDDPELLDRMQDGLEAVGRDLVSLLRYQGFGGVQADKDAASNWLSRRALVPPQDRLFIAPGAHPALLGIFGLLAKPGDVILSEHLTYPGTRSIAAQLGLKLVGLPLTTKGSMPLRSPRPASATAPKRSTSTRRCSTRRPTPSLSGVASPLPRQPAASAWQSSRMTRTASCRSMVRRRSRRSRRTSPGTSPGSPSVSAPACGSPM
jgi:DNA-binding transcriptional MocR family regulator